MKAVFFSLTGQTKRFANKLGITSIDISSNPFLTIDEDFVLLAPTYDKSMTEVANQFLEHEHNLQFCRGIIGIGNKNFADLFIYTAKDLAFDYDLELLYGLEFSGTSADVEAVLSILNQKECG
ncbi:MAG: class Ib ribonucleoside-diphosphate reductase assembly flavoprotein NrdI [Streptococcaceae bacterium]|jgi:protein involved in ribonucleotide reduction|nr:class Ib ribonucleoside-diphosphate reductase assembly flavoprotein NrdI [Streptococcaceae bacterium]